MTVFEATGYKTYLTKRLALRGMRSGLAVKLGCRPAHISQVLGGKTHFSLEYAVEIDRFLGHAADESRYFLLLVHRDRAGTKDLRHYYENQLEAIRRERTEVRRRISVEGTVAAQFHDRYYASWLYAAIHVMLSIPRLQNAAALAEQLRLPLEQVAGILAFLERAGLARREGTRWRITQKRIHLDAESPLIARHHTNWRLKAVQSCDAGRAENLHYSAVFTLAEADIPKVREIFLQSLREAEGVLVASPEETTFGIGVDFFRV